MLPPRLFGRRSIPVSLAFVLLSASFLISMSTDVEAVGSRRPIGGAPAPSDPNSPENQAAAEQAVGLLNEPNSGMLRLIKGPLTFVELKEVTTQVVAGLLYKMKIVVQDANGASHNVQTTLWSRPWLVNTNDVDDPPYQLSNTNLID